MPVEFHSAFQAVRDEGASAAREHAELIARRSARHAQMFDLGGIFSGLTPMSGEAGLVHALDDR